MYPKTNRISLNFDAGTSDYFGLNHYTSRYVKDVSDVSYGIPHFSKDIRATLYVSDSWPNGASEWFKVIYISVKFKF